MKIPKYWARHIPASPKSGAKGMTVSCWDWSDVSVEDAQRKADARALALAEKLRMGARLDRYAYGDRALHEEVVQTVGADAGTAVVTRNLYGTLVLNAARAMFMDVDFPDTGPAKPSGGMFGRLFGKPAPAAPDDREARAMQQVQSWAAQHSDLGVRVYRTCAGLRCLITSQPFDPKNAETISLLRGIGSDPLYVRLCQAQGCFRARLTPKPWRCGLASSPLARYPWNGSKEEAGFRAWLTKYERHMEGYSVCRLLTHVGPPLPHPEIAPVLELHDKFTCGPADQPLA